ncbi:MAG: hypothetical protein OXI51_02450 [Chloroflexota bacterium]|nr:hypothetical protein [Chloroflexota bacterium]
MALDQSSKARSQQAPFDPESFLSASTPKLFDPDAVVTASEPFDVEEFLRIIRAGRDVAAP